MLFMMHTGCLLYHKPSSNDEYYINARNGWTKKMVLSWDMDGYIDDVCYDLINNIIKPENKRYNIEQILDHPYLNENKIFDPNTIIIPNDSNDTKNSNDNDNNNDPNKIIIPNDSNDTKNSNDNDNNNDN